MFVFPCNPHRVFLCFASLLFSEQLIDWLNMFARVECLHGRFKILRKKRDKTAFECPRIWSCSFMSAFRCFCCCCCWSINCEGGRQIKSFESFVFESQNVSDVCCCCCCCCRCCFCLVCHVYPGDVVVVVVRLSLTLDLGNATCFTHLRKELSAAEKRKKKKFVWANLACFDVRKVVWHCQFVNVTVTKSKKTGCFDLRHLFCVII